MRHTLTAASARSLPWGRLLIALAVAGLALGALPGQPASASDPAAFDASGAHYLIDCDVAAPGIQDVCGIPFGTADASVGVYIYNNGGPDRQVGSFDMFVHVDEMKLDPKAAGPGPSAVLDSNPDVNQSFLTSGVWSCGPAQGPSPDTDPFNPADAISFVSCFDTDSAGPTVGDTDLRLLATIRYDVVASAPGFTDVTFSAGSPSGGGGIGDTLGNTVVSCGGTLVGTCHGARIYFTGPSFDADGDGLNNAIDNCIEVANVGQENSDRIFDLPPTKVFDDATRASSDRYGDACDFDDDNDGLADTRETTAPCASASAATNPLAMDTDGDLVTDRAECILGSDPANVASLPAAAPDGEMDGLPDALEPRFESNPMLPDSDGDLIIDGLEVRGHVTSPASTDSDGDGCPDGKEIASVNGDINVNSIDFSQVAQQFSIAPDPKYIAEFDLNKDGRISSLDMGIIAKQWGNC